jgi:hypothetical protein
VAPRCRRLCPTGARVNTQMLILATEKNIFECIGPVTRNQSHTRQSRLYLRLSRDAEGSSDAYWLIYHLLKSSKYRDRFQILQTSRDGGSALAFHPGWIM